ncbi:MAG: cytochrome P450 [Gemmatimonadales bacterium]|nr:MAG: cytochrome P450 [Gemmatimonadales bacterium]
MKTHLALDALGGAALCALPFLLDEEEDSTVSACVIGLGVLDLAVAPLTQTQSTPRVDDYRIFRPHEREDETSELSEEARRNPLPEASAADTARIVAKVLAPKVAQGPIIRRPAMMAVAESMDVDTAAVRTLQEMRDRYGSGPLMLKLPGYRQAILLDPEHVRRVLDESPEPFATATVEKQAALAHFEPEVALISHGEKRESRRRINVETLEPGSPVHHMAQQFLPIVEEEAGRLLDQVGEAGELTWDDFGDAWFAVVRRVVFGNEARDDRRITDIMVKLRSDANWAILKPRRTDLRDELHERIRGYIERAESGSLAAYMAEHVRSPEQKPEQQIPQWLFAFEPAGMATFRALALLARHPEQLERARKETGEDALADRPLRPFLRACVLEALRLWPTTPLILRETTRETRWEKGIMPTGTGVVIFTPFFHRDDQNLSCANTFSPDLWLEDDPEAQGFPPQSWPLVPFSGGAAHCPGQNLVLLLTSGMLAALVGEREVRIREPERMPPGSLPGSQDHSSLRFEFGGVGGNGARGA